MTLTKDDLSVIPKGIFKKAPTYMIIDEILKNQEGAEKCKNYEKIIDELIKSPNWVKGTREFAELFEIVERLKKRIEELSWAKDSSNSPINQSVYLELQKILGEEK